MDAGAIAGGVLAGLGNPIDILPRRNRSSPLWAAQATCRLIHHPGTQQGIVGCHELLGRMANPRSTTDEDHPDVSHACHQLSIVRGPAGEVEALQSEARARG